MSERRPSKAVLRREQQRKLDYNERMARAMEEWSTSLDWSERLKNDGVLTSRFLMRAFKRVRRYDFLTAGRAKEAGYNGPIPIGYGQSNSQPLVVAIMLEALNLRPSERVLDFGAGSGWTTALIADVVGRRGRVIGTEIVPQLVDFGNSNLAKYSFPQANIMHTPNELGYSEGSPYDAILVSARLPEDWLPELEVQLSHEGGRVVAPVTNLADYEAGSPQQLICVTRQGTKYDYENLGQPVAFVPTIRPS